MKPLADLIEKRKKEGVVTGRKFESDENTIRSLFFAMSEKEFPNLTRADFKKVDFRRSRLFVLADHPGIASEISRCREKLRGKVNAELGSEVVKEIKIK